jgi:hypothetical protein
MSKRLTVDVAVRWLHQEKLECRLEWYDEDQRCGLAVYDAGVVVDKLAVYNGCIEEGDSDIESVLELVAEVRAPPAAKPTLELV